MDGYEVQQAALDVHAELPRWWLAMSMGERLRLLREFHGVSQRQLADTAGMQQSAVSRLEAGGDALWSTWARLYEVLGYGITILPWQHVEEVQDGLDEEADRRDERRRAGLER